MSKLETLLTREITQTMLNQDPNLQIGVNIPDGEFEAHKADLIDMVKALVKRYYSGVTRYTTSTFLRAKLGSALERRDVAPHIFESLDEARQHLEELENRAGS